MEIEPAALEAGSNRMLQQTTALASAVKKKDAWEALFTSEQINGWLAVDMVKNHPNVLPPMLHDPRVAIDPTGITIACRFEQDSIDTVLSLTVEPYASGPRCYRFADRQGTCGTAFRRRWAKCSISLRKRLST